MTTSQWDDPFKELQAVKKERDDLKELKKESST